jgi:hypothetical protein
LGAIIIKKVDKIFDEAALLEVKGFRIKLVHDDLLGPYFAAVGKKPELNNQLENLIHEILPKLEAMSTMPFKIINETNIPLYVSVNNQFAAYLKPGKEAQNINEPVPIKEYLVVAGDGYGNTVFSQKYPAEELKKTENFTILIS